MALHNVSASCLLHGWSHTHTASLDLKPPSTDCGGFPGGSASKESTRNAGNLGSIPGLGRSAEEGKGYPLQYSWLENPHGHRSLVVCSPWGRKESDMTKHSTAQPLIGKVFAGAWAFAFPSFSTQAPRDADAAHLETTLWVALLCMLLSPSSNSAQKTLIWTWLAELKGILRGYLDSSSL